MRRDGGGRLADKQQRAGGCLDVWCWQQIKVQPGTNEGGRDVDERGDGEIWGSLGRWKPGDCWVCFGVAKHRGSEQGQGVCLLGMKEYMISSLLRY
jgi:hypothetical protein